MDQALFQVTEVVLQVETFRRQHGSGSEVRGVAIDGYPLFHVAADVIELLVFIIDVAEFLRQLDHADHTVGVHDRHALHQVRQLAHVARPAVTAQGHDRGGIETDRTAFLVLHARDQFVHQQRDILHALAQRGHLDWENVEAVVQVFAEAAHLDHAFEVLVGGRDDAHIDALGLVAAHAFEGTFLQHTQQLDLHRQRHIADFIKEQGAAVGQLETPGTAGDRPGKGALLVAEQFAFEQLCRDRPAVDRHKRPVAALGVIVQVARDHFLAGARLAEDQHAGVGIGHLLHHLAHVLDRTAGADEAAEQIGFTVATALTGLVVHLAIDLGAMQGIEQFAVAGRHFQSGKHAAALVFGQLDGRNIAHQQHGKELIPGRQCL